MTTIQFYRGYVWAPLVFGSGTIVSFLAGWEPTGAVTLLVTGPLAVSVLYGGIPYAALAIWTTWWLGGKDERQICRLAFRMPLLMIGVYAPSALVYGGLTNGITAGASLAALGAAYTLLIGYIYVGLGIAIHAVLRGFGCVAPKIGPAT